jgi:hypothetical protein
MFITAIRNRNAGRVNRPIIGERAAPEIAIIDGNVSPPPPIQSPPSSSRVSASRPRRTLPAHSPSNVKLEAQALFGTSAPLAATAAQTTSSGNRGPSAAARAALIAAILLSRIRSEYGIRLAFVLPIAASPPGSVARVDVKASWIRSR